jgi:RNA polymerase sigma factor (sigma-70 family)
MPNIISIFKSDNKLIEAIRDGDDTALGYLYEKNLRMITKYIKENNGNDYDASEILQDALVILWEKILETEFVLTSKISTFLYGIVKRKWLQELARRKRYTVLDEVKKNPGTDNSAEENLQESETIEIVKSCIKQLSPLCQKILVAHYYQEKSMTDICKLTGLANENVAKSKKYQCKKQLEQLIKSALNQ